eukprot:7547312-Ditylum_brightwellii.AAC.1
MAFFGKMKSLTATLVGKKSVKLVPQCPFVSHKLDNTPLIPSIDRLKPEEALKKTINTFIFKICFNVPRKEDIMPKDKVAALVL